MNNKDFNIQIKSYNYKLFYYNQFDLFYDINSFYNSYNFQLNFWPLKSILTLLKIKKHILKAICILISANIKVSSKKPRSFICIIY